MKKKKKDIVDIILVLIAYSIIMSLLFLLFINNDFYFIYFFVFVFFCYIFLPKVYNDNDLVLKTKNYHITLIIKCFFISQLVYSLYFLINILLDKYIFINFLQYFKLVFNGERCISLYNILQLERSLMPKFKFIEILDAVVFSSIIEELFFRKIMFIRLKKQMPLLFAMILSSVLFGLFHMPRYGFNISLLLISINGFIYCYSYIKTENILFPIILHSFRNMFTILLKYVQFNFLIVIYFIIFIIGIIIAIQEIKKYVKRRQILNEV